MQERREFENEAFAQSDEQVVEKTEVSEEPEETTAEIEETETTPPVIEETPFGESEQETEIEKEEKISEEPPVSTTGEEHGGDYTIGHEVIEEEVDFDATVEDVPKRAYQLPSVDYLDHYEEIAPSASDSELVDKAEFLTQSLATFGVEGHLSLIHI